MLTDTAASSVLSDYLTKTQLAEQLGRSVRTLDRMALSGVGPPRTKIGRTTLYRRQAVLEWLRSREVPAGRLNSRRREPRQ
jgi:predicted DNA-binding transcriptional regulator AlpA